MGLDYRHNGHIVSRLSAHIVWVTKYRKRVLTGDIQLRCRDIIKQVCDSEDIVIIKVAVTKDHVHMLIEYRPSMSISEFVKPVKGRSSRKLQMEFPKLQKEYWGRHFWAIGYGVWSTGNITEEMVKEYLEHHNDQSNYDSNTFVIEE